MMQAPAVQKDHIAVPGSKRLSLIFKKQLTAADIKQKKSLQPGSFHFVLGTAGIQGIQSHIEQMLEKDGQRGFEVRIFRDPDEYAQYLQTLVSETHEADRTGADTEAEGRAMTMLYSISL